MHRNTAIFITILAVMAGLVAIVNIRSTAPQQAQPPDVPTPAATPAYLSGSACGVSFQYPNTLTVIESTASGTILANTTRPNESIVIMCQKTAHQTKLTPEYTDTMTIQAATGSASASATLYHDTSAKDGAPVDNLIFTHPKTGLDVFVGGFGPIFNQIITTLKLL